MKFTCSVDIDLPREKVVELWENPDNLAHWQDGYQGMEHISGTPGKEGAKSLMRYEMGKRGTMELTETILKNDLPHEFAGLYEAKSMVNTMSNWFIELSDHKTQWKSEIHYSQLNGFMIRFFATIMPGMFKKQVQKWMDQFKAFAEKAGGDDA